MMKKRKLKPQLKVERLLLPKVEKLPLPKRENLNENQSDDYLISMMMIDTSHSLEVSKPLRSCREALILFKDISTKYLVFLTNSLI